MPMDSTSVFSQLLLAITATPGMPEACGLSGDEFKKRLIDHHHYLLALLRFKTGDEMLAEDLLQDTYLAFLRTNPDPRRFDSDAKLKNYLITIALNKLRSHFRSGKGGFPGKTVFASSEELTYYLDNLPSKHPEAEESLIAAEEKQQTADAVALAMERLPERQRRILELKFTRGLDNPQISAELSLGVKAVESLLFRAKAQFKKEFEKITLEENVYPSLAVNKRGQAGHEN